MVTGGREWAYAAKVADKDDISAWDPVGSINATVDMVQNLVELVLFGAAAVLLIRFGTMAVNRPEAVREWLVAVGIKKLGPGGLEFDLGERKQAARNDMIRAAKPHIGAPRPQDTAEATRGGSESVPAVEKGASVEVVITPEEADRVLNRAKAQYDRLKRATILWVDDNPENNDPERNMMAHFGVRFAIATSNGLALAKLEAARGSDSEIDVIISDIRRVGNPPEDAESSGLALPALLPPGAPPVIYYVMNFDPALGTPQGALGITMRPDTLFDLVMDVLERKAPPR